MTRRRFLGGAAVLGLAGVSALDSRGEAGTSPDLCRDDIAIDGTSALLFPAHAPLTPGAGLRDARAVWGRVPDRPDRSALVFLHGYDNYVTVDAGGRSRVPDWAAGDPAARAGASGKPAAPLAYGLGHLGAGGTSPRPVVLVPEVGTLASGAFWAKEPAGQYADPARLGALVGDCFAHLGCLRRPDGRPYLSPGFGRSGLRRVFLSGHSGSGLILQEAAGSALIQPAGPTGGVPADLWLLDCTYWSEVTGFVEFCRRWHAVGRVAAGRADASRLVCVYRPGTQTEAIADSLRGTLAGVLGVPAASLVCDHTAANFETAVRPALRTMGALFLRTWLPHDDIPTFFLPRLLATAGGFRSLKPLPPSPA